ncbi:MAG TPA: hypothetical protein VF777_13470 [Phycisphaerales bacterium]
MATSVLCVASSEFMANDIVGRLRSSGFSDSDISILFPDKTGQRDFAHETNTKAPEGAAAGASAGGVIGGTLGLLAGIGMLAIPGVGPFIAAGPIMAALSGVALGAATGGIGGALVGLGIPEIEAKRYEGKVRGGNILISAHTENAEQIKQAKEIYRAAGATDITSTSEASTPDSNPQVVTRTDRTSTRL